MVNHTATDRPVRRSRAFRVVAAASSALVMLTTVELGADRRSSGGSVRQSNNTSRNAGANRDNNYDRNTNANQLNYLASNLTALENHAGDDLQHHFATVL